MQSNLGPTYKLERHFSRHGRRAAPKFRTRVRIDTLSFKKSDPPQGDLGGYLMSFVHVCVRSFGNLSEPFFDTAVGPHRAQIWHACADR